MDDRIIFGKAVSVGAFLLLCGELPSLGYVMEKTKLLKNLVHALGTLDKEKKKRLIEWLDGQLGEKTVRKFLKEMSDDFWKIPLLKFQEKWVE